MAQTVTPGTPLQITLASGGYFNLSVPDKATAQVTRTGPDGGQVNESIAGGPVTTKIGPHIRQMSYTVTAVGAACSVDAVDGDGNSDKRVFAAVVKKVAAASGVRIGWGIDSTTDNMAGLSLVGYAGTFGEAYAPSLRGKGVTMYNHGLVGTKLADYVTSATGVLINGGGVDCCLTAVAAQKYDVNVISAGLNDWRGLASIVGSYGSAGQLAQAAIDRANLVAAATAIRVQNPSSVIVLRMPNGCRTASASFFSNGVTGDHIHYMSRLVYRGDVALGLPPLTDLIPNSVMFDTLAWFYADTAYANAFAYVAADGFHPGNNAYRGIFALICRLFSGEAKTKADELAFGAGCRPTSADTFDSTDWVLVTEGVVQSSTSSVFQLTGNATPALDTTVSTAALWGAASGSAYGATKEPTLALGDVIVVRPVGLPAVVMPIRAKAVNNAGGAIQWTGGATTSPSGYGYPDQTTPNGSPLKVYRHRLSGSYSALNLIGGTAGYQANYANAYEFWIDANANGSITIQGVSDPRYKKLSGHTVGVNDVLCIAGVDGVGTGTPLTGATFIPDATAPGKTAITLAGVDFSKWEARQGILLSDS